MNRIKPKDSLTLLGVNGNQTLPLNYTILKLEREKDEKDQWNKVSESNRKTMVENFLSSFVLLSLSKGCAR